LTIAGKSATITPGEVVLNAAIGALLLAGLQASISADLIPLVTPAIRTFSIAGETRVLVIDGTSRVYSIEFEDRTLHVE